MHILLTDLLTCPRCGPEHGLIVLAEILHDRRVREGELGCPNCRELYPIRDGLVDLRAGEPLRRAAAADPPGLEERAYRVAALLGIGHGPGTVLLLGAPDRLADEVARLLPNAAVAVGGTDQGGDGGSERGLLVGSRLPFRSGSLRGVAVIDAWSESLPSEAARVLARGSHLVLDPAPAGVASALRSAGLEVRLDQEGVAVASTP